MSRPPPGSARSRADVVVLGGNLPGLLVALELLRRGQSVSVLVAPGDASGPMELGHAASGPGLPFTHAVERFGPDAATAIWQAHREGHEHLRRLLAELGEGCGYRCFGSLLLGRDREEATALADSEDQLREQGFPGEFLDHYMLESRFDVRGFAGGYWAADDAELDPRAFARALARAVVARGGALHEASVPAELSVHAGGVEAVTSQGRVRGASLVIAARRIAEARLPALARLLEARAVSHLACEIPAGTRLPSPARTVSAGLAWSLAARHLRATLIRPRPPDQPRAPLPALLSEHMPAPRLVRDAGEDEVASTTDGLAVVGSLPGLPATVLAGFGLLDPAWAAASALWVAEALVSGSDRTPAVYRASRLPATSI